MIKNLISRFTQMIIVLFVLSIITFILMKLTPGNPIDKILQLDVANVSSTQIEATKEKLGLNQPLIVQYFQWLTHIVRLDFGLSYQTGSPVIQELLYYAPPTLIIALCTIVVVLCISIPLGVLSAKYYHTWIDTLIRTLTSLTVSVPSFFVGILLIYIFAQQLQLLPSSGTDNITGYILPVIALSIGMSAYYVRLIRSTVIEQFRSKEVEALRIRGMSEYYILWHDMFKPTMIPVVTMLGMSVGSLIGGTVVIENLFGIPGLGYFLMDSIRARDYPVVQGAVLLIGFCVVIANIVSDLLLLWLDPKRRSYQPIRQHQLDKQGGGIQ